MEMRAPRVLATLLFDISAARSEHMGHGLLMLVRREFHRRSLSGEASVYHESQIMTHSG